MHKIDLGQSIAIIANVGVILGIVFLAFELRQNTDVMELQVSQLNLERQTDDLADYYRYPDLRRAYVKFAQGERLTVDEDFILGAYAARVFATWRWRYEEQDGRGLPVEAMQRAFYENTIGETTSPMMAHYWQYYRESIDPEFREWFESNVAIR